MESFFYHSFPRRRADENEATKKGLNVLESILVNGLLLVPEEVTWADPTSTSTAKITSVNRRVCFTELLPDQLLEHAQIFGPFALEFSVPALRSMGAMPVIYIPDNLDPKAAYGNVATLLLAHLVTAQAVAQALAETQTLTGPTIQTKITFKNNDVSIQNFDERQTVGIQAYLSSLERTHGLSFKDIAESLKMLGGIFYPTENLTYTGILGYYRQREWRIVSGTYWAGQPTTSIATKEQAEHILSLDKNFFAKEINFADGRFSLAEKSHFLSHIQDQPLPSYIRRIIVPKEALGEAVHLVQGLGLDVPVEQLP